MWTAVFIAAATAVLAWLGHSFIAGFRQGGYDEARAEEAARDLEAVRKQEAANAEALEARETVRRAALDNPDSVLSDDDGFKRNE
jgi:hypothetical protein